ncbi:MAG TPA: CoA transferase, partial [Roseiarcus sp.]|nr:CoA transferase [Roseiarcus sp.]
CSDGHIIVAAGNDGQYQKFVEAGGRPELARDPRFATNPARVVNRVEMERLIVEKTRSWKRDDLLAVLEKAVVPAGPINTIADLFADPQFNARRMQIEPQGAAGLRTPILMSESPLALERRSPRLGEHQAEVLREIGLEGD